MSQHLSLLHRLVDSKIDFVIVGGYAAIIHGCNYVTQDIDICCVFETDALLSLQDSLANLHPVHRMTPKRLPLNLNVENAGQIKNLYLDTDLGRIDCLSEIQGLGNFEEVKKTSEKFETKNCQFHVLTIDALIKAKQAMNRPRDHEIIRQLEAIKALKNTSR